jgi:hypothetical protein
MRLIGLDLNATRARAVAGAADAGRPLALEGESTELPLAVSLEGRTPVAGRAALAHCRRLPHLTCSGFLPELGTARRWSAGRHRLDAAAAVGLAFERLEPALQARGKILKARPGLVLALPPYLTGPQLAMLTDLVDKARWSLLGSVTAPLALARAALRETPWSGSAILADIDDHALTWSIVAETPAQAHLLGERTLPALNLQAWKSRLVDAISDRCIRHSRRDPRDSAVAEQMLYDQLDDVQDASAQGQAVEITIQAARWGQNLILQPQELAAACVALRREAVAELLDLVASIPARASISAVCFSAAAAVLPGLIAEVEETVGGRVAMTLLPAETAARGAHDLAACFQRGELAAGHLDFTTPLAPPAGDQATLPWSNPSLRAFGSGS